MKTQLSQALTDRAARSVVRTTVFPPNFAVARHHPSLKALRNDVRVSSTAAVDEVVAEEGAAVEEVVSQAVKQVSSLDRIGKVSGRLI